MTESTTEVTEVAEVVNFAIPDTAEALATPRREQTTFQKLSGGVIEQSMPIDDIIHWGIIPNGFATFTQEMSSLSSADDIARLFASRDIKGDRNVLGSCPISEYIKVVAGVPVETNDAGVCIRRLDFPDLMVNIPLTLAMYQFVENFDAGLYPELVR